MIRILGDIKLQIISIDNSYLKLLFTKDYYYYNSANADGLPLDIV